jgi:ubiquinone/menaquinone biosynthesis C-methylase UbiE
MSDDTTGFVGSIPENYDRGFGPILFTDYAEHTARHIAGYAPSRVLETGAGTGIVTRRLRDLLPATTRLIATDLNPPMLDVARKKFHPDEPIEFQHADAMALPFADASALIVGLVVVATLLDRTLIGRHLQRNASENSPDWLKTTACAP